MIYDVSRQGQTNEKNAISWPTCHKAEILSKELLLRFISSFHYVLVLIRAFQKYYDLSRDFLLTSAFYAFLWKFKLYSKRAISFMKYQKTDMKDILFSFHLVKK